jgi:hypothetical protein
MRAFERTGVTASQALIFTPVIVIPEEAQHQRTLRFARE